MKITQYIRTSIPYLINENYFSSESFGLNKNFFAIEYAKPIDKVPTTAPWAATLNCIKNRLVPIFPRCLYLYAPIPHTATNPTNPVKKSVVEWNC